MKPFMTAANKIASITIAPPLASSIVKNILLTNGPQTTRSLHALLHSPEASVILPSRPPPPNFLAGLLRTNRSPQSSYYSPSSSSYQPPLSNREILRLHSKKLPGFKESSMGIWSMAYLKKKVLKQMEGRAEIVKVTRGKFDTVSKRLSGIATEGGEVVTVEEVVSAPVGSLQSVVTGKGKKTLNKKLINKEEEEHVWVVGETWRSMLPASPASVLNPRKDTYVELKARQKVEKIGNMKERERIGLRVVS